MRPLALVASLDGIGEMTSLDLGTQRCKQPLQPFFERNRLLFPRLVFAWSTGLCAAGSFWRHPQLSGSVVGSRRGGAPNYRASLRNRPTPSWTSL